MQLQKVKPIAGGFFRTRRALGWGSQWGNPPAGHDPNFPGFPPQTEPPGDFFKTIPFAMHQFCVTGSLVHEISLGVLTQPGYLYNGNITLFDYVERELPESAGVLRKEGELFDTVRIIP